jgi:plastocyanin
MRTFVFFIVAVTASLMISCSEKDDNGPGNTDNNVPGVREVNMSNTSFLPSQVTITAGTTVKWTNGSSMPHTVTSSSGLFNQHLNVGETFSYTFTTAGSYSYTCTLHPGMDGVVTVQ